MLAVLKLLFSSFFFPEKFIGSILLPCSLGIDKGDDMQMLVINEYTAAEKRCSANIHKMSTFYYIAYSLFLNV